MSKFYKMTIPDRVEAVNRIIGKNIDQGLLQNGGLSLELADSMI
jgi:hypothetical protein